MIADICLHCTQRYCCTLTQVMDTCPFTTPEQPRHHQMILALEERNPFDTELDRHLEQMVTQDFPLTYVGEGGVHEV